MRTALLVAGAFLLVGADAGDDADKELKKLQGTWVLAAGEKEGEKLPDEHVKASKITWKGKEASLLTPHQSKEIIRARVSIDPSQKPKQMEWVRSTEPGKGQKMYAIYEFIDGDTYRVCFALPGKERPTEFTTKPGSGHLLHVWKRAKE